MRLSVDAGNPNAIDCFETEERLTTLPLNIEILGGVTGLENAEQCVRSHRIRKR